jgi:hypothetical protein
MTLGNCARDMRGKRKCEVVTISWYCKFSGNTVRLSKLVLYTKLKIELFQFSHSETGYLRQNSDFSVGWTTEVRFPAGAAIFFSSPHRVQIDSGAHPASYPMGTGSSFPGVKAAEV